MLKILSVAMLLGTLAVLAGPSPQHAVTLVAEPSASSHFHRDIKIKKIRSNFEKDRLISIAEKETRKTLRDTSIRSRSTKVAHDFDGNEYLFISFGSRGYSVVNVANDDVVEISPFAEMPFAENDEAFYIPWVGYFKRFGNSYFDIKNGRDLNQTEVENYKRESSRFAKQSVLDALEQQKVVDSTAKTRFGPKRSSEPPISKPLDSGFIYADHEVPHSWFFKRNLVQFPRNGGEGSCGYVAASMLLAYNEIFKSTGYFFEKESVTYITPYKGTFDSKGWNGVPDLSDSFTKGVWGDNIGGSVPSTIHSAIDSFMNGKGKQYEIYDRVWEFANPIEPIKKGYPAAYFGNIQSPATRSPGKNHVVTVYGYYDNGKLLVHYGWENNSQVVMSRLGIFSQGGVIAIYNKSPHVHNDRYFIDRTTGKHYCGCGKLMSC